MALNSIKPINKQTNKSVNKQIQTNTLTVKHTQQRKGLDSIWQPGGWRTRFGSEKEKWAGRCYAAAAAGLCALVWERSRINRELNSFISNSKRIERNFVLKVSERVTDFSSVLAGLLLFLLCLSVWVLRFTLCIESSAGQGVRESARVRACVCARASLHTNRIFANKYINK